ncbi:hypothetical protein CHS0354_033925 [Potamilus streckersoni]|uniref:Peptidase S8/S53 domain-containing protein n=1 Tax=Potamilus streckersoni TaxID=2493646 RepID=A0AAE0VLI6_9BIVA|nr:hypothetical protein CHS0354_033925 [Potamilus streckersoni]
MALCFASVANGKMVTFFRQEIMHKRGDYLQGKEIQGPSRIQRETKTESFLYKLLGVDKVWNKGYYGNNVTVAVVDCGVDMNHEDLRPNIVPHLSYDYIDRKEDGNPPIDYQDSDYLE